MGMGFVIDSFAAMRRGAADSLRLPLCFNSAIPVGTGAKTSVVGGVRIPRADPPLVPRILTAGATLPVPAQPSVNKRIEPEPVSGWTAALLLLMLAGGFAAMLVFLYQNAPGIFPIRPTYGPNKGPLMV